jgi:hypothetical protein
VAIDEAKKIVPNLKLDDSLQPVDCARGNLSDLVAEFDKYVVAVEVTLSRGRRQYATETEPVTFHVGRYKKHELDSGGSRKVYGLFIAPTIDRNAAQYFHQYVKHLEVPDCGNVTVVPIDLNAWKDIFGFANSLGYLKDHALGELLHSIEESALKAKNGDEWLVAIPGNVSSWKAAIAAVQT